MGFQKTNTVCGSCKEHWLKAGRAPMKLVILPTPTQRYGEPIRVCPYCDGPVIEVALAAEHRKNE